MHGSMQGLLGACSCSMCPSQPSKEIINGDKLKEIVKGLGAGEVSFDEFGTLVMNGKMVDQRYRPGGRDIALDATILTCSTEAITLVHPKLYENCMLLLERYYKHTKRTREKLERVRVASAEGAIPLTLYDALAWQIMKGPPRAADIAISITRLICRESKGADRMACLLWKRDKKSKSYQAISSLVSRLGGKKDPKSLQEDCVRILARLGPDNDRMMRLAQMKPILKAFSKVLEDGTVKTIDTALWLTWRMTPDADFCQRLFKNTDLMKSLIRLGTVEQGSIPGVREENALAILANLSVQEEMCAFVLERYPELLKSAAASIDMGSTRAAELGALLIGNLAFDEMAIGVLKNMDIDVCRLVGLLIEGGDRARELSTLALANLTRMDKFVEQFLAEDGAMEVILSVRESGATGRAREAAGRIVANCSVTRLKTGGVTRPLGKGKVTSEHTFFENTFKTQDQIKQFGFLKKQSFSTPWAEAKVTMTGRFPEIAKRCESQVGMASSKASGLGSGIDCDVSEFTASINMPAISSAESSSDGLVSPLRGPRKTMSQRAGGA